MTYDEASEARKSAGPTISAGSAMRPRSVESTIRRWNSGWASVRLIMSVSNGPGAMAFTRMWGAHSLAIVRVKFHMAAFAPV